MSAIDPKKYLQDLREKHALVAKDMAAINEKLDQLKEASELAEAIESELWSMIKDVEKEMKDDEDYLKLLKVKANFVNPEKQ